MDMERMWELFIQFMETMRDVEMDKEKKKRIQFEPKSLWDKLAGEGNYTLIDKLKHVENNDPGFGTIVVPKKGFSEKDDTHNDVLKWLKEQNINILNVGLSVARMEQALRSF